MTHFLRSLLVCALPVLALLPSCSALGISTPPLVTLKSPDDSKLMGAYSFDVLFVDGDTALIAEQMMRKDSWPDHEREDLKTPAGRERILDSTSTSALLTFRSVDKSWLSDDQRIGPEATIEANPSWLYLLVRFRTPSFAFTTERDRIYLLQLGWEEKLGEGNALLTLRLDNAEQRPYVTVRARDLEMAPRQE